MLIALAMPFQAIARCDTDPTDCSSMPPIDVIGTPIDAPQWIPQGIPFFNDPGYDINNFIPNGYWGQGPIECSRWKQDNPAPGGCDQNVKPPPVTASDPPCGPDGSIWSNLVPQGFGNACMSHDVCYSLFGSDKDRCDSAFVSNMDETCALEFVGQSTCRLVMTWDGRPVCFGTSPGYHQCLNQSGIMYGAVQGQWAGARFAALRTEARCRHWHSRKENESDCP